MLSGAVRLSTQQPRAVVVAAVGFLVVAAAIGGDVEELLTSSGFQDPDSESERTDESSPSVSMPVCEQPARPSCSP
jgi:hypothetical protein